jgi:D-aminopeptidase
VSRLRELGLRIGDLEPGPLDSIADVPGVAVGHVTVWRDEPEPPAGRGVGRSGVTAVVTGASMGAPLSAGTAVLNGAGELTGSLQVREWGVLETPVFLTATMAVGRVYDGAVAAAMASDPGVGSDGVVIPVVGECDDSWLSEARVVQVEAADAGRALAAAASAVAEGAVGAGTGMVCFERKGGIGTASRRAGGFTVGVLVLANFGAARELRIDGVPIGRLLEEPENQRGAAGSCIVVVATDAPLGSAPLERIARRAGLGLARTGSTGGHGSGEIFLAFSVAREVSDAPLDALFTATVDATEEAVVNALWAAQDTVGRAGREVRALPRDEVLTLLARHGRLAG